jgi:diamine N-acetyltransferase
LTGQCLSKDVTRGGAVVSLREITADTVRAICALETSDAQKGFVSPNSVSIAQAHFHPTARFKAIYADDTPVGFIMWRPAEEPDACYLWRFMIDQSHQGRGYGRAALQLWLESLTTQAIRMVKTSYVAGDAGPREFYRSLGFQDAGEVKPNGEWPMTLAL